MDNKSESSDIFSKLLDTPRASSTFKEKSINEIESAMSEGLSKLFGYAVKVKIHGVEIDPNLRMGEIDISRLTITNSYD